MNSGRTFWAVVVAAVLMLLVRAGDVPLMDPDESRFARTSVEMLRAGDPVVPRFGGEPRLVKPPLVHWIQSALFSVVGPREWAARLHAAAATLGSLLLLGWLARRRFGPEGRVWTVAVFITMPLVFVPARVGTLDALLAVHVLAVLVLDLDGEDMGRLYRSICTGALLGLAFLVKGPVGVILPLLVMLAGRTAAGRNVMPSVADLLRAAAAWCAVVLPWGFAFIGRVGSGATLRTLKHEVLERYFAGTAHPEPPWFFLLVGAVGFLPWIGPLALGIGRAWRMRRDPVSRTALYASAGLIVGLVFFSIGRSKVASYILPLAPLAAIVVAWELGRELEAPRERTAGPTLIAATLTVVALLLGTVGVPRLEGAGQIVAIVGAACFAVGALAALWAAARREPRGAYAAAAGSSAALLLAAVLVLFPALGSTHSSASLIRAVPELAEPRRSLVTVEVRVPSLTFYTDKAVEVIEMSDFPDRIADEDRPFFVMVDVDVKTTPPSVAAELEEIGRHGKYRVFTEKTRSGP